MLNELWEGNCNTSGMIEDKFTKSYKENIEEAIKKPRLRQESSYV
jgi:hypothetical protein